MKHFFLGIAFAFLLAFGSGAFAATLQESTFIEADQRIWMLIFCIGLIVAFGLGAMKGGQR